MKSAFPIIIDGRWRDGGDGAGEDVVNPATGDSLGQVAHASRADLDEALEVAARGLLEWRVVSPWERGRILKGAADRLRADADAIARTITLEQGKPLAEAKVEIVRSAEFLEWGGEQGRGGGGGRRGRRAPRAPAPPPMTSIPSPASACSRRPARRSIA